MKCSKPWVESAGDCDHLAVIVNKLLKEIQRRPQAILNHSYKNFDPVEFLVDVQNCPIDEAVLAYKNIEEAASTF